MHINQKYELPRETVNLLAKNLPTLQSYRLVHGLICLIYQRFDGLRIAGPNLDKENTVWCQAIADLTAPIGANDHRWLKRAVADLDGCNLFKVIGQADPKRLVFRFDRRVLETFGSCKVKYGFAKMQTADLGQARTVEEAAFVMLSRLNERRNQPMFDLPFGKILCTKGHHELASGSGSRAWEYSKRRWCSAIQRVADRLDHSFLVAPNRGPMDAEIARVIVKMQNDGSEWSPQKLYKFPAGSGRVIQFMPGAPHRSLKQYELRDRLYDTLIR
ncbi:hypothetical protein A3731_22020 [Roseovarius sp. HI0049]|nr:hypothetical protein A3731_26785 [Roseovarius sp. HI0049]KZY32515.1 hypothetical protein A3731_22020 [Roseovarius sp. HI0049]